MMWRAISAWPDPSALLRAVGTEVVKQRAAKGEGEAQFSQGCLLVNEADRGAGIGTLGGSGRSPQADVGLEHYTAQFPVAHRTEACRCGHLIKRFLRLLTLGGGGHGASWEGGGARARVRYV